MDLSFTCEIRGQEGVAEVLRIYRAQIQKSVQTVRSDNGKEFMCLEEFFQDKGIVHQTSCVDTPQQNGRACGEEAQAHIECC